MPIHTWTITQKDCQCKYNNIAEQNFGKLDRLIGGKPNVNMITFEAVITNRTNKISEWRKNLSPYKYL